MTEVRWKEITLKVLRIAGIAVSGVILVALGAGIVLLNQKPDLSAWHTAKLDEEFTRKSSLATFEDYLELENRLFEQVEEKIYSRISLQEKTPINRYHHGSLSDPGRWSTNWNRSFYWGASLERTNSSIEESKGAVLLIHGLTDSPYSLRTLGRKLQAEGYDVLGLRVPGHGTAPAGLSRIKWQDMAAAVDLTVRHLHKETKEKPIHIVGYSNGGALALHYALTSLENPELPQIDRLILISPEIGVSSAAAFAVWQKRIGRVLGLKKLGWNGVRLEYDPFKYNSFPINAADLAYKLTAVNREKIHKLHSKGALDSFPQVLAFQSEVDATVTAEALVTDLFSLLPDRGHELVVFGLNRMNDLDSLFTTNHRKQLEQLAKLRDDPDRNYRLSVITNVEEGHTEVLLRSWRPSSRDNSDTDLELRWPPNIYSLSHIALPFPETDPLNGGENASASPGIQLGNIAMRGERGTLHVSAEEMLRLRWNPFYSFLEEKSVKHLEKNRP